MIDMNGQQVARDEDPLDKLLREVREQDPIPAPGPLAIPATTSAPPSGGVADVVARMTVAGFEFPAMALMEPYRTATQGDADIIARLRTLATLQIGARPDARDYIQCRHESCGLNIALNERKTVAPAFRPYRRAAKPGAANRSMVDRWVIGDRAVIDLHWFWTAALATPSDSLQELFDAPEFSFHDANLFVRRRVKTDGKVNEAGLSELAQLMSTAFRSASARDRWRTIEAQLAALRRTLLDRSHTPRHRLDRNAIEQLQRAGCALLIARGSSAVASQIIVHVGGEAIDADRMRDVKKRLERLGMAARGWGGVSGR